MSEPRKRKRKGERPDGRIQVTLTVGIDESGKPIRKSFYGATRKEAEAKRAAYLSNMQTGLSPLAEDITFEEWIDQWISLYNIDANRKKSFLNRLKKDLGKLKLRDVKEAHLHQSLFDGYEGKSTDAARKYRNLIQTIFKKAVKNHLLAENPADELTLPKTTSNTHRALDQWEIDCILKYYHLSFGGKMAIFMLLTGMRRGECLALNWNSSIDLENRLFHVNAIVDYFTDPSKATVENRTKTKAGARSIPMCQTLYDILNSTPIEYRRGLLFHSDGNPLNLTQFVTHWKGFIRTINERLNSPDNPEAIFSCTPHDLRHTYATILYDAGVDVKTAQNFLGHTNAKMTLELYTHLSSTRKNQSKDLLMRYRDETLAPAMPIQQ